MINVGVNGYGTIGKRVADAVAAQPDMSVIGIAKTSPDFGAAGAVERGYDLYTIPDREATFRQAGYSIAGSVEDLIEASDVVVDATPGGIGETYLPKYRDADTPAIFQGKERHELMDASFVARANYEEAVGADYVRVVSCNTTGISRLIAPLSETYGIEKARVTLVRRGGDPDQPERGPINDTLPNPVTLPSHHGPDVNTIFPNLSIDTLGLKVPVTLMHVHSVNIQLEEVPTVDTVLDLLARESRIFLINKEFEMNATGKLKSYAQDIGRPRGDIWENCLWAESVNVVDNDFYCFQAIHQESDVIPENVDAIRAVTGSADQVESMALTDETLEIGLGIGAERIETPAR